MSSIYQRVFLLVLAAAATAVTTSSAFLTPTTTTTSRYFNMRMKLFEKKASSTDSFDMEELQQRIYMSQPSPFADLFQGMQQQQTNQNVAQLSSTARNNNNNIIHPTTVYIVSFQQYGIQRGVHSIEYPKGSGDNIVLAFSTLQACTKFAGHLRAQRFYDATPQAISVKDLALFCNSVGVYMQIIPNGIELIPPTQNVEQLGQRNTNQRQLRDRLDYLFDMADGADFEEDGLILDNVGAFE